MKLHLIFALGLSIAAVLSCEGMRRQSTAAGPHPVQITKHSILIPGTAISGADREAVTTIFKKYDDSLYRIVVYEKGHLKKPLGKMSEMNMGTIVSEYSANAQASGLTNWTMKIGFVTHHMAATGNPTHMTGNPTHMTDTGNPTHVTPTGSPTHAGAVTHASQEASDALVKEVTPILEKYSK
jgi:hypothetical protein